MTESLADHIAALIIHAVRQQGDSYGAFVEDLRQLLETNYGLQFSQHVVDDALDRLEALGSVQRLPSPLAGDLIQISVTRALRYYGDDAQLPSASTSMEYDALFELANSNFLPIKAYSYGGKRWIDRVVTTLREGQIAEILPISGEVIDVKVPASDRIVSLSDNQRVEIDQASQDLATQLALENSVDGDAGLRERFLAQIAAGRELIRAGSVRAYLLYELLVRLLGTLIEKYKGQLIAETAKKLLGLLIENIFGK